LRAGRPVSLKAQAVRLLARREYARDDLEQRLIAKGAARDEVVAVLDELSSQGLLSNERFAHALVAQKSGSYSRRSIRGELKRKGISGEAIEGALGDAPVEDEAAMLRCGSAASERPRRTIAKRPDRSAFYSRAASSSRPFSRCCARSRPDVVGAGVPVLTY
jgi:regulatory protein